MFVGKEKDITYKLIFKDLDSLNVFHEDLNLSLYDDMNTGDRKRILLINCPFKNIDINGIPFRLEDFKYNFYKGNSF